MSGKGREEALSAHEKWQGKIEVTPRAEVRNRAELSVAYTPGVAEPCLEISRDPELSYRYTRRGNLVAVASDRPLDPAAVARGFAEQDLDWDVLVDDDLDAWSGDARVLTDDYAPVDQLLTPTPS